ncbi:MAG: type II secretion system protein [Conexivisphaerales archaeon]
MKKAFTLLELMVAVSIVMILVSIVSFGYSNIVNTSIKARVSDDVSAIQNAISIYIMRYGNSNRYDYNIFTTYSDLKTALITANLINEEVFADLEKYTSSVQYIPQGNTYSIIVTFQDNSTITFTP